VKSQDENGRYSLIVRHFLHGPVDFLFCHNTKFQNYVSFYTYFEAFCVSGFLELRFISASKPFITET
jgi:hypothetical protein